MDLPQLIETRQTLPPIRTRLTRWKCGRLTFRQFSSPAPMFTR